MDLSRAHQTSSPSLNHLFSFISVLEKTALKSELRSTNIACFATCGRFWTAAYVLESRPRSRGLFWTDCLGFLSRAGFGRLGLGEVLVGEDRRMLDMDAVISFCAFFEQYLQLQLSCSLESSRISHIACGINSFIERNLPLRDPNK